MAPKTLNIHLMEVSKKTTLETFFITNLSSSTATLIAINRLQNHQSKIKIEANLWSEPVARILCLLKKMYRPKHFDFRNVSCIKL